MQVKAENTGQAVRRGYILATDLAEYQEFSPLFDKDVYSITLESSTAARDVIGGTAPRQVERALTIAKKIVGQG
jgi:argininosuccinate lyase